MRPVSYLILVLFTALALSGCIQNGGDTGGKTPQTGTWTAKSEYGVKPFQETLHERIVPGEVKTWAFRFENIAASENPVEYNAACAGPFRVTLIGTQGNELQYEEPRMDCQGFDRKTLEAGDSLEFTWTWDGKIWSDGAKTTPIEGIYTIRVGFEGHHAGNPEHVTDGAVGATTVFVAGRTA